MFLLMLRHCIPMKVNICYCTKDSCNSFVHFYLGSHNFSEMLERERNMVMNQSMPGNNFNGGGGNVGGGGGGGMVSPGTV